MAGAEGMKKKRWVRLGVAAALAAGCVLWARSQFTVVMPGDSFAGPLPVVTEQQVSLAEELRQDVKVIAARIGERNVMNPGKLAAAEDYLAASLAKVGYRVQWQTYPVQGVMCSNLIAELAGTRSPDEIVVVGAHYDAFFGSPSANDNGSGTAATLSLARHFAGKPMERTVRFVFFVNEEPPFFWTDDMGSLVYARSCKQKNENIVAMISLETMGFYSDAEKSQAYPPPLSAVYPSKGNFIAFVGMKEAEGSGEAVCGDVPEDGGFSVGGSGADESGAAGCGERSLVVLEAGLAGGDGDGYGELPVSALSPADGYVGEAGL